MMPVLLKRTVLAAVLAVAFCGNLFAQGTDAKRKAPPQNRGSRQGAMIMILEMESRWPEEMKEIRKLRKELSEKEKNLRQKSMEARREEMKKFREMAADPDKAEELKKELGSKYDKLLKLAEDQLKTMKEGDRGYRDLKHFCEEFRSLGKEKYIQTSMERLTRKPGQKPQKAPKKEKNKK